MTYYYAKFAVKPIYFLFRWDKRWTRRQHRYINHRDTIMIRGQGISKDDITYTLYI